jgi:carboxypeptidase T
MPSNTPPGLRFLGALGAIVLSLTIAPSEWNQASEPTVVAVRIAAETLEQRSAVAAQGYAIEAVSADSVIIVVSAEELSSLGQSGLRILETRAVDTCIDDEGYHTYEEMLVELAQTQSDHVDIVQLSSLGKSIEGREIYALKISDHAAMEEDEPEVLVFALTHAREHLSTEQAIDLIRYYTDNYGVRGEVTNLVNQREIWILPNVNPDGNAYDYMGGGCYRSWRKNRRVNGDNSWGVDLNRNYGYRWGYDAIGSSPIPNDQTYRGAAPFSEPETQVLRDFVISHPGIVSSISLHTYGEQILWPYGYTTDDLPVDINPTDRDTFARLARTMANLNGYTPQQASMLYPTNGGSDDWLYAERGVFAFTFELYPVSAFPGFYPDDGAIPAQTARNRGAVSYLIGVSDFPRKVVGVGGGDTQPPVSQMTRPTAGDRVHGSVRLEATAADDTGVTLVEFLVDGMPVGLDDEEPFTVPWDSSSWMGSRTLSVAAYDGGQNVGHSPLVPVLVVVEEATPTATPLPTATATRTIEPGPTATATPTCTVAPPLSEGNLIHIPLVMVWCY